MALVWGLPHAFPSPFNQGVPLQHRGKRLLQVQRGYAIDSALFRTLERRDSQPISARYFDPLANQRAGLPFGRQFEA